MTIARKTMLGGAALVFAILLTLAVAGFGINRIRIGGEADTDAATIADFIADIAPPAEYVIEPYLRPAPARQPATRATRPTVREQQARVKGFALDLGAGGPDVEDEQFGRAA